MKGLLASWNGDTRTASWRVLSGSSAQTPPPVASAARNGFLRRRSHAAHGARVPEPCRRSTPPARCSPKLASIFAIERSATPHGRPRARAGRLWLVWRQGEVFSRWGWRMGRRRAITRSLPCAQPAKSKADCLIVIRTGGQATATWRVRGPPMWSCRGTPRRSGRRATGFRRRARTGADARGGRARPAR